MQGCTPLHLAAQEGHADVLAMLASVPSCELDAVDVDGRTALHHAAARGRQAAMMELWGRGAHIEPIDRHGWSGAQPRDIVCLPCRLHYVVKGESINDHFWNLCGVLMHQQCPFYYCAVAFWLTLLDALLQLCTTRQRWVIPKWWGCW